MLGEKAAPQCPELAPAGRKVALETTFQTNEELVELLLALDHDEARITELGAETRQARALEREVGVERTVERSAAARERCVSGPAIRNDELGGL